MTSNYSHKKAERLEARISHEQKELFQHAANLLHRSLTDFIISSLIEASQKVIQKHKLLQFSLSDEQMFIATLLNPPKIHKNLKKAVKRYKQEFPQGE